MRFNKPRAGARAIISARKTDTAQDKRPDKSAAFKSKPARARANLRIFSKSDRDTSKKRALVGSSRASANNFPNEIAKRV